MPVTATTMRVIPVVVITVVDPFVVIIVTTIVHRAQEVMKVRRDASPLPPRRRVGEAEMNSQVNPGLDHVVGQI